MKKVLSKGSISHANWIDQHQPRLDGLTLLCLIYLSCGVLPVQLNVKHYGYESCSVWVHLSSARINVLAHIG